MRTRFFILSLFLLILLVQPNLTAFACDCGGTVTNPGSPVSVGGEGGGSSGRIDEDHHIQEGGIGIMFVGWIGAIFLLQSLEQHQVLFGIQRQRNGFPCFASCSLLAFGVGLRICAGFSVLGCEVAPAYGDLCTKFGLPVLAGSSAWNCNVKGMYGGSECAKYRIVDGFVPFCLKIWAADDLGSQYREEQIIIQ
jgi:hypothetical protein